MTIEEDPDFDEGRAADFFIEYASAMLSWQRVEHSLFLLFFWLMECPVANAAAVFYSVESFGAKLRITDGIARVRWHEDKPLMKRWDKLRGRMAEASSDRNVLAHHTTEPDVTSDGTVGLAMAPAYFVPGPLRRKRKASRKLDAAGCGRLSGEFGMLSYEIGDLLAAVDPRYETVLAERIAAAGGRDDAD